MSNDPAEQKQSISDDQELAKVLAGINDNTDGAQPADDAAAVPTPPPVPPVPMSEQQAGSAASTDPAAPAQTEDAGTLPTPAADPVSPPAPAGGDKSPLDIIKQQALGELRPLVDKLQVEPDEKFDIYLLLLRSTDDKDLIAPAHEAAKAIVDESKRAQALLDVIKEIDFLNQPKEA